MKTVPRAGRNRTIALSRREIDEYAGLCRTSWSAESGNVINSVIHADAFDVLAAFPDNFIDLLVVDPPYNLNKVYSGKAFKKMGDRKSVV
jgi:site-specific DNA-methyltransferase (adenine-specific)